MKTVMKNIRTDLTIPEHNSNGGRDNECCTICLSELEPYDMEFPLLCSSKECIDNSVSENQKNDNNVCFLCLSHLNDNLNKAGVVGASSKGPPSSAPSCPKCWSDVSPTIEDTLFLRTVAKVDSQYLEDHRGNLPDADDNSYGPLLKDDQGTNKDVHQNNIKQSHDISDDTKGIKANHTSKKYIITPINVQQAKQRLQGYQNDLKCTILSSIYSSNKEIPTDSDGDGIINEENAQMIIPNSFQKSPSDEQSKERMIDIQLLSGLHKYMSTDEQAFITELLTSGDTLKLAQAAQILSEIRKLNLKQLQHGNEQNYYRDFKQSSTVTTQKATPSFGTLKDRVSGMLNKANTSSLLSSTRNRLAGSKQNDDNKKQVLQSQLDKSSSQSLPPLPKYVVLHACHFDMYAPHRKIIKFRDDKWDGTVGDAYARVYQSNLYSKHSSSGEGEESINEKKDIDNSSSFSSLSGGEFDIDLTGIDVEADGNDSDDDSVENGGWADEGNQNNETSNQEESQVIGGEKNRVIITAARRQAYAAGIRVGDVVTHVNMEEFKGDAEVLRSTIHSFYQQQQENSVRGGGASINNPNFSFALTLNAEQNIANFLKHRAFTTNRSLFLND